jgi:hypothetical protein
MSTVTQVPYDNSVTRVLGSSGSDVMGKAMAVLLTQYMSLQDDLKTQIDSIEERNATKGLWNQQLSNINKLLQSKEFMGKKTTDEVELTIKAEDLPYQDYAVVKDADGNLSLQPTSTDKSNMVSDKDLQPIYGVPGTDAATAAQSLPALEDERSLLLFETRPAVPLSPETATKQARIAELNAQIDALKNGPVVGYKVKITAEQLNRQLDTVRNSIDALNTDGQIDMLRVSDLFSKANTKVEQVSKILSSADDTADKIISSMR